MPNWLNNAIFYEIYPQSFKDSNGDGIGDFIGIIEKLDYIKSLGFNALWINPCFDSPFMDAGYDVADYYKTAPRYGTNDDLIRLFNEAHSRDIKVLLDLVPGHTSYRHKWFEQSAKPEKNIYTDRYIWTSNVWEDAAGFRSVNGMYDRDGNYIVNFFSSQPALNYGFACCDRPWQLPVTHPAVKEVREELYNIIKFWLDAGADGFRVDMPFSLVKNDDGHRETIKLWQGIRRRLDRDYPEAALISEWSIAEEAIEAGFHMDFYLHFHNRGYNSLFRNQKYSGIEIKEDGECFFDARGRGDITVFTQEYLRQYNATKDRGYICIPTGNHDMIRISQNRDKRQIKLVYAFIMTMPGVPFVYYGDEIGMRYNESLPSKEGGYFRTGARTPMQWDKSMNAGFSSADASSLYLPVDNSPDAPDVKSQFKDENSLLNSLKALIKLRGENKGLWASSHFSVLYARENEYPFVYERDGFVAAVNPSCRYEKAVFNLNKKLMQRYLIGEAPSLSITDGGIELAMAPESFVLFTAK